MAAPMVQGRRSNRGSPTSPLPLDRTLLHSMGFGTQSEVDPPCNAQHRSARERRDGHEEHGHPWIARRGACFLAQGLTQRRAEGREASETQRTNDERHPHELRRRSPGRRGRTRRRSRIGPASPRQ